MVKSGIGYIHELSVLYVGHTVCAQSGDGKGHGNAVILFTVNGGAAKGPFAVNDHAVLCFIHMGAHGLKVFNHHGNPVGFLDL